MNFIHSYRVTVFVPAEEVENFIAAVSEKLPVLFGNYDRVCWWSEAGSEQFRPLDGANPTSGEIGKTQRLPSIRVEFSLPETRAAVEAFIKDVVIPAHPWEAPVILLYKSEILSLEKN